MAKLNKTELEVVSSEIFKNLQRKYNLSEKTVEKAVLKFKDGKVLKDIGDTRKNLEKDLRELKETEAALASKVYEKLNIKKPKYSPLPSTYEGVVKTLQRKTSVCFSIKERIKSKLILANISGNVKDILKEVTAELEKEGNLTGS